MIYRIDFMREKYKSQINRKRGESRGIYSSHKMKIEDQFQYLVGGYYGVEMVDEYELKIYLLKEIEEYIKAFVEENKLPNFNYYNEAIKINEKLSDRTKLQDALLVLNKIKAPMEIVLYVKQKLKKLGRRDNF